MAVAAVIFTFLAIRYEYVDEDADKKPEKDLDELPKHDSPSDSSSSSSDDDGTTTEQPEDNRTG